MQNINDISLRLNFFNEADALDFEKTGRAVLVVEDNQAELPLPKGDRGEPGPQGKPGSSLRPDLVLDETTDSLALAKLQERSLGWRTSGLDRDGYFAINKPTKSGFFYGRNGWTIIRDVFGGSTEILAAEMNLPVTLADVDREPSSPKSGVTLYSFGGKLKMINSLGERREL